MATRYCAGGSEGTFINGGRPWIARFGSVRYAKSALPAQRAAELVRLVEGLKATTTVSVLVAAPQQDRADSGSESGSSSNGTQPGSTEPLVR